MTGTRDRVDSRPRGATVPGRARLQGRTPTIRDRVVRVGGARTHYLTAGHGRPLVLLHGTGDGARDWHWVLPALARRFRVIAPDLPGFGPSSRPPAHDDPSRFPRFVAALLDTLRIPDAIVVGHSLGGLVALRFALDEPGRVPALVLADSAGLGRGVNPALRGLVLPGLGEWATTWVMTPVGQALRLWWRTSTHFAHPHRAPDGWVAEQDRIGRHPEVLRDRLELLRAWVDLAGQRMVWLDRLPDLTMPTLVLWGEHDLILPLAQARDALGRLRQGRLAVIPDCGHLPHIERPVPFVQALDDFFEGLAVDPWPRTAGAPGALQDPRTGRRAGADTVVRLATDLNCLAGEVRALLIRYEDLNQHHQTAPLLDHLTRAVEGSEGLLRAIDARVLAQHRAKHRTKDPAGDAPAPSDVYPPSERPGLPGPTRGGESSGAQDG